MFSSHCQETWRPGMWTNFVKRKFTASDNTVCTPSLLPSPPNVVVVGTPCRDRLVSLRFVTRNSPFIVLKITYVTMVDVNIQWHLHSMKCSWADSHIKMWRFSDVLGTDSIPFFRVLLVAGRTFDWIRSPQKIRDLYIYITLQLSLRHWYDAML